MMVAVPVSVSDKVRPGPLLPLATWGRWVSIGAAVLTGVAALLTLAVARRARESAHGSRGFSAAGGRRRLGGAGDRPPLHRQCAKPDHRQRPHNRRCDGRPCRRQPAPVAEPDIGRGRGAGGLRRHRHDAGRVAWKAAAIVRHRNSNGTVNLRSCDLFVEVVLLRDDTHPRLHPARVLVTGIPRTSSRPQVGGSAHAIIRIVVVLPAPFGPRKPKHASSRDVEADGANGFEVAGSASSGRVRRRPRREARFDLNRPGVSGRFTSL